MVNEWTSADLPEVFDDSRYPGRPWNPSPNLMADLAVWLNEHHPKPASEVTRADLPDFGAMGSVMARWKVSYGAVSDVLDAVVAHLNANGGVPARDRERDALVDQPDVQTVTIGALKYERDRWRRAHAIVEQERDQARRERDEWRASTYKWHGAWQKIAPARAVTREDVDECVYGSRRAGRECDEQGFVPVHVQEAVDRLFDLFGVEAEPADPVGQKAAELFGVAFPGEAFDQHPYVTQKPWINAARHVLGQEAGDE